jgi:hypothetical protein
MSAQAVRVPDGAIRERYLIKANHINAHKAGRVVSLRKAREEAAARRRRAIVSEVLDVLGFAACLLLAGWACTDQAARWFHWLATTIT